MSHTMNVLLTDQRHIDRHDRMHNRNGTVLMSIEELLLHLDVIVNFTLVACVDTYYAISQVDAHQLCEAFSENVYVE